MRLFFSNPLRAPRPLILPLLAFLLGSSALAAQLEGEADQPPGDCVLWYRQPASSRSEALPIGNGRIGALVYGGVEEERIEISESTLWSSPPAQVSSDDMRSAMEEIRALQAAGKLAEADAAARKLESSAEVGRPLPPIATLRIKVDGWESAARYRRSLNLRSALASSQFEVGGALVERDALVSAETDALLIRWSCPGGQRFDAEVFLDGAGGRRAESVGWTQLRVEGEAGVDPERKSPRKHSVLVLAMPSGRGKLDNQRGSIKITNARSFTLVVAIESGFDNRPRVEADKRILALSMKAYDALGYGNLLARRELFDRVDLRLGPPALRPTDHERLALDGTDANPALDALAFQTARYLMASSSRETMPPMASCGVWPGAEESKRQPYDLAAGLPLAYELAGPANLLECVEPLQAWLTPLMASGKAATGGQLLEGWGAFGAADRWGSTAPSGATGLWPFGAARVARVLSERHAFQGGEIANREAVRDTVGTAFGFASEANAVWPSRCIEGSLLGAPSPGPFGIGWGIDHAIGFDGRRLGWDLSIDPRFVMASGGGDEGPKPIEASWIDPKSGRLAALPEETQAAGGSPIGRLYALYPGRGITRRGSPALTKAAKLSLEAREALGDRDTPLGRAWIVGMWARLGEGERAHAALRRFIARDLGPNLAFAGSDERIDSTLLAAAGMAEMLLQSHAGEIELLPALPAAWPEGRVSGLGARGGFSVMIEWKNGKLARAMFHSRIGGPARVRAPGLARVAMSGKKIDAAAPAPDLLEFPTEAGAIYSLDPAD